MRRIGLEALERVLYPVIPVVVTAEHQGRVGGMLAAWWMQASFTPPILAVAIAPERYTYKLVRESGVFAFNLLDFKLVDKAPFLGDVSERLLPGKIREAGLNIVRGEVLGAPLIAEASAAVELELVDVVEAGDHDVFLGEAKAVYTVDDFRGGMWSLETYRPLMYLGRTRRPGPVYRVYLTPRGWERREIEFAGGKLKPLAEKRVRLISRVEEAVKASSSREEAVDAVRRILSEEGLDPSDAEYLVEDALRRAKSYRRRGQSSS
ncbi:putative flavoredoxin [Aeropyrum pernix K1]|uniref:Uncharacterized protein APE_2580 n=1 Tax=Aeropyrum pernix (strain ATCC 700893 / DSM 11879 / JCM 9820 / NBRC 100138 / K1) TaxID=272557 RepID=Y2580_AERPE|nr:flavin reductase family protein [Aeropyrum pernix]Q9Y8Q3.1 RecName: Full=Uncharacterized protein APE_2580 [Aeropyrum pernix K1]BAA81597.1 putative flavoredoxin [Aeropyrum pernix K1]